MNRISFSPGFLALCSFIFIAVDPAIAEPTNSLSTPFTSDSGHSPSAGMPQSSIPENFDNIEIKPVTHRPCLLEDPSDVAELRRRFEALPNPPWKDLKFDTAFYALLYNDEAAKKKASAEFMPYVRKMIGIDPHLIRYRRFNEILYHYDIVDSFGYLTKEEEKEFKDDVIRVAKYYIGDDPAKFPSPKTPNNNIEFKTGFGTCNRWPDTFLGAALVGLNFPDLPLSKPWVKYACEQTQYMLAHGNWDGAWNEVPRYHNWTMLLTSTLFDVLKRRAGVDFYQDPNTKAMLDWYVRFSSPLVRFPETSKLNPKGEPTLPVWGDSSYGNDFYTCAMYAPQYVTTDPALSKRLMWMWRRAGSPFNTFMGLGFLSLANPTLPDAPQTLGSDLCKKFGLVLMRSGFNTPDETVVYMRGGDQSITHMRSDLGSIDLFSQGIPLALGSESGPYSPEIEWNRSQQSNNDVVFGGESRDRRECRGKIDAFYTSPAVDYVVADCSRPAGKSVPAAKVIHWRRHLLLVKQPDYLVVWDEISSPMPSEWFLHTTAEKLTWGRNLVTSHTAYNADLDIHVLLPSSPLAPNEKEGRFGEAKEDPQHPGQYPGKPALYPFNTLKYFSLPAKPGEDFLTILHPRKPNGSPLATSVVSASKKLISIRVNNGAGSDLISLGTDGASFQRGSTAAIMIPMKVEQPVNPSLAGELPSGSPQTGNTSPKEMPQVH